ncbi:CDP-glucose 4,6-dehydratase [Novosphingobium humi]|uniref:CDP-glucose 4,6-dehydratase n=1 Tax=Novosphingobium humi TaxID=2282397 RepID=A0ABY7TSE9_9SPHN|nr:CDP-glucose 4,6-dehydratase [Novosphingobium humi]WCT76128.1 CDP-glucose 4,6-dehydratase [Novosphingobium humi]
MAVVHDPSFWAGRRVLLTGHTGFKGSWLALWLHQMGAVVTGLSLAAEEISLFRQARVESLLTHIEGDIRDMAVAEAAVAQADPEVVFHLAAQPLVRLSYDTPVETFATNVQGTVHVLDACRRAPNLRAIVAITSDKAYENREWVWPYRECDPMGGHDPYSASKGAAELVIAAYRRSFFSQAGAPLLASVRAGNVIGGGDWALDRLVPDIIRALIAGERPLIRSPHSIRPWQHVLEALGGYLLIAQALAAGEAWAAEGWNFGPADDDTQPVSWIADRITGHWGDAGWDQPDQVSGPHEAKILKLDCAKARNYLGWRPVWGLGEALGRIVEWHKGVAEGGDAQAISLTQLAAYRALFQQG